MKGLATFFLFTGQAKEALDFYANIFGEAFELISIKYYESKEARKVGMVNEAVFLLKDQEFRCTDSLDVHDFGFTPAISIFLDCDTEVEIDRLTGVLSAAGQVMMPLNNYGFSEKFAWVSDRFGISWQLNLKKEELEIETEEEEESVEEIPSIFSEEQIKEIAEEIHSGLKCYIHKKTKEITTIIDDEDGFSDMELWEEQLTYIEENYPQLYVLEKMTSRDGYEMMEEFIELLPDRRFQNQLVNALNQRRPFANFKHQVDNSRYRADWFKFRDQKQLDFTKRQIRRIELDIYKNQNKEV